MSITTFAVVACDAVGCDFITPMIEMEQKLDDTEELRSSAGFSFLDVPFANHADLYICQKCLYKLSGIEH